MSDKKPGPGDNMRFGDAVDVGLSTEVVPPAHPCPTCGVETKETALTGWRLCTDCDAQHHVGLSEAQHMALLDEVAAANARSQRYEMMYKAADVELTAALRTLRDRGII
jgi:hypothetical protein